MSVGCAEISTVPKFRLILKSSDASLPMGNNRQVFLEDASQERKKILIPFVGESPYL